MGRKNRNVGRSKDRGRRARQAAEILPRVKPQPRSSIEQMVLPDGRCTFQTKRPKARFDTEEKARRALKQAQAMRTRMNSHHVEKRYYKCPEGGCGGWHLTSREEFDESLRSFRQQQFEDQTKNRAREAKRSES